jgi:hypothetical protein
VPPEPPKRRVYGVDGTKIHSITHSQDGYGMPF